MSVGVGVEEVQVWPPQSRTGIIVGVCVGECVGRCEWVEMSEGEVYVRVCVCVGVLCVAAVRSVEPR